MLEITIPGDEFFNQETQLFETRGDVVLQLEHSLVSLSKWESRFKKPFLGRDEKTIDEVLAYIEAMVLTPEFSPEVFSRLTKQNFDDINAYIESSQSATTFSDLHNNKKSRSAEVITSELIYYWMVTFNIPLECENWHLNRLFALVKVCSIKNSKPEKMSKADVARRNRELNAERRRAMGTTG